jgi:hypothetical protein
MSAMSGQKSLQMAQNGALAGQKSMRIGVEIDFSTHCNAKLQNDSKM